MGIIQWNEASEPRRTTLADVLYEIRREDSDNLLMDSVTPEDIIADSEGVLQFDALVIPYQQLHRRMMIMRRLMNRVGTALKVEEDTDEMKGMVISEPFKKNGAAHVAVTFNLEDGQTITVFFHNPDATPQKIGPTDDLISWKWLINKKDVTIIVAPEHGKDLDVHEVARRIMKLADKNSAAFARANAKKAERLKKIEEQESELERLEKELAEAKAAFEEMKAEAEVQVKRRADVEAKYLAAEQRVTSLTAERNTLKAKKEAAAVAKKTENEKTEATKNFPPIQDNNDFADFQEEHGDDGYQSGEPHNQHMLTYLVSTGQTHFCADIPDLPDAPAYEEWKYENNKWAVKQGKDGYWDDSAAEKDYWAFKDFAIGVRNGSLTVLSGNDAKAVKAAKPRKISSVRQFCELINESNSALEADDKLQTRLMAFLEKEWPNFEGRAAEGAVRWNFRDGEWYFTGDDGEEKPRSAVDTDGTKVIFDFYGADANNTLRRAESKPAETPADSDWAAAEAELNQIIAGTHPKFGDESLQEPLIAYYQKYENDPEKIAVVNAAIDAWQTAALKASEEITSGKAK